MPAKAPHLLRQAAPLLAALGAQIRARRKTLGIRATAAAESAGMSRVTWYRIEKGEPSVAAGAYANAAHVLGLDWRLDPEGQTGPDEASAREGWLPARVPVADYPELARLAWQVPRDGVLTPREALSIYERNARHMDASALASHERALLAALRAAFAGDV